MSQVDVLQNLERFSQKR